MLQHGFTVKHLPYRHPEVMGGGVNNDWIFMFGSTVFLNMLKLSGPAEVNCSQCSICFIFLYNVKASSTHKIHVFWVRLRKKNIEEESKSQKHLRILISLQEYPNSKYLVSAENGRFHVTNLMNIDFRRSQKNRIGQIHHEKQNTAQNKENTEHAMCEWRQSCSFHFPFHEEQTCAKWYNKNIWANSLKLN